ncbi:MAG: phosphotransferase, partial [Pseudomonadota bacterium]|nr:phosphotransferase [Pseudomonadota bacterium]
MKFLWIEKPTFTSDEVGNFITRHYGFQGALAALESERDQNFRVVEASGRQSVLKIANCHEAPDIVAYQVAALDHIARTDPRLPVPRVIRTSNGDPVVWMADGSGHRHAVHMLTWLDGDAVGECSRSGEQLRELGNILARLGIALRGFFHSAAGDRGLLWD